MTPECLQADTIRLSDREMMGLNLIQIGVGLKHPDDRFVCPSREDGDHVLFAGALGTMIALPHGYLCPVCSQKIPARDIPEGAVTQALQSSALISPDYQAVEMVRARMLEVERIAEDHALPVAYTILRSLEQFLKIATQNPVTPPSKWQAPYAQQFPVSLLLELHNGSDEGSFVRKEIRAWLDDQRLTNPRQHWLEAIVVGQDGRLVFDPVRYDNACYRGKQETYLESVESAYGQLTKALGFISHFQELEDRVSKNIVDANTLYPARVLGKGASSLKEISTSIGLIAQAMESKGFDEVAQIIARGAGFDDIKPLPDSK